MEPDVSQLRLIEKHQADNQLAPNRDGAEPADSPEAANKPLDPPTQACENVTPIHFTAKAEQLQLERTEARSQRLGLWQRFRDWLDI